jgi:D-alanyl-D-alanine carboxypeptidase
MIDTLIQPIMHDQHIPGMALAIQRGQDVLHEGYYGLANLEHGIAVTAQTVFEIASVTKLLTAQAVLHLAQGGKISLDEPVMTYLPDLPQTWNAITVRHCLAHQSGIPNYTSVETYGDYARDAKSYEQVLDLVRDLPLNFPPGTRHAYDNTGFYLLGLLIEAVSGKSYGDYLGEIILNPLGMTHTQVNDYDVIVPNRAQGYVYADGLLHNKPFYDTSNTFSAGILLSTVRDLLLWRASLFNDSVLNAEYRKLWWTPHLSVEGNERPHYMLGLGWFMLDDLVGRFYGHNGGIPGFATAFLYLPVTDVTAVVMCNTNFVNDPHKIALAAIQQLI